MAPTRRALLGSVALTLGLAGCTGGPGGQSGTDEPTDSPTATESSTDAGAGTPAADATVTVGPDGSLAFDPETLEVEVGATVRFRWDSGGHTVTVDAQPEGANWEATGQTTHDSGHSITHTFDVAGQYDYYCVPHRGAGMVGSVVVGDAMGSDTATTMATDSSTPTSGGDDGGGYGDDY